MNKNVNVQRISKLAHKVANIATETLSSIFSLPAKPKGVLVHSPSGTRWEEYDLLKPESANDSKKPQPKADAEEGYLLDPFTVTRHPVLVVGEISQPVRAIRGWVNYLGGEIATTCCLDLALESIVEDPLSWGLLVVCIDEINDLHETIDALLLVRSANPKLPIILLSEKFSRHEFGVERRAICDVSLKIPASFVAFQLAIAQAVSNNRLYGDAVVK
ncbi:hypothetical protein [Falsiruegeria mediterranea]|uniref:Response regulatory domain-containing protein n=1 Tax=Falsiruegeria mediterranea M17 TaxID=1200281 RepID=A0A2R8C3Z2_9RHOB|nr:hypothetical protein [Falsiruegeria mediterranea]SPJ27086.1 hypothetical protein TRM7615_00567 [Falsiruegeria mediterranea M17]